MNATPPAPKKGRHPSSSVVLQCFHKDHRATIIVSVYDDLNEMRRYGWLCILDVQLRPTTMEFYPVYSNRHTVTGGGMHASEFQAYSGVYGYPG